MCVESVFRRPQRAGLPGLPITVAVCWGCFCSPDPEMNELMVKGVAAMADPLKYSEAYKIFSEMIKKEPNFSEVSLGFDKYQHHLKHLY